MESSKPRREIHDLLSDSESDEEISSIAEQAVSSANRSFGYPISVAGNTSRPARLSASDDGEHDEDLFSGGLKIKTRDLAPTKKPAPAKKSTAGNVARQWQREQREQEKRDRQADRERKKHELQQERARKKREQDLAQQASGKFARKEIAVLIDEAVYEDAALGIVDHLKEEFAVEKYESKLPYPRAIQWIRRDFLSGGAESAYDNLKRSTPYHYQHLEFVVFIVDPDDFLPLIQNNGAGDHGATCDIDDDYPALEVWLDSLTSEWRKIWNSPGQPRLLLVFNRILETLDSKWIAYRRARDNSTSNVNDAVMKQPPTESELQDAVRWILIQFQVDATFCSSPEHIQATVFRMTRSLCERPYVEPVSELECIRKLKTHSTASSTPLERTKDLWLRQLQQVPMLSEKMARNIVRHYPTARSLWHAYQELNGSDQDPALLVSEILSGIRRQDKLSENLYRIMTSSDPKEMIL